MTHTTIRPLSGDLCLTRDAVAPDATAQRVARLQTHGVYVFPYAPGRWRVVWLDNALPRIVGNGETLLEALGEAEDFARGL